jgi:hypothetical protein
VVGVLVGGLAQGRRERHDGDATRRPRAEALEVEALDAQAPTIEAAASGGISPSRAHARASAASTSSSACHHERPSTIAATVRDRRAPRTASDVEEDGLAGRLDADVESEAIVGALGQQRRTPVGGDARQHGVVGAAPVDPRGQVTQQATREHVHERKGSRGTATKPAPSSSVGTRAKAAGSCDHASTSASGSGPPRAVEDVALDAHALGTATGPSCQGSPIARYGPTVCEGVGPRSMRLLERGASRPPSTMSNS